MYWWLPKWWRVYLSQRLQLHGAVEWNELSTRLVFEVGFPFRPPRLRGWNALCFCGPLRPHEREHSECNGKQPLPTLRAKSKFWSIHRWWKNCWTVSLYLQMWTSVTWRVVLLMVASISASIFPVATTVRAQMVIFWPQMAKTAQVHMFLNLNLNFTCQADRKWTKKSNKAVRLSNKNAQLSLKYYLLDHDECAGNIHQCQQRCLNFPGGYSCSCLPGYTLNRSDNRTCDGKSTVGNHFRSTQSHTIRQKSLHLYSWNLHFAVNASRVMDRGNARSQNPNGAKCVIQWKNFPVNFKISLLQEFSSTVIRTVFNGENEFVETIIVWLGQENIFRKFPLPRGE